MSDGQKKTTEELLEEQNALLRRQNELLEGQVAMVSHQSRLSQREATAKRWDTAHPVGKYLWMNPYRD